LQLRKIFSKTKFGYDVPMVPISANIGAVQEATTT
jgi:hypothetical protein